MGVGNGVFHPSDFAILNANVAPQRLGHAYSTHGIGGNLGYAVAPIVVYGLGSALGWRPALAIFGLVGLAALALLASQRAVLTSHKAHDAHMHTLRGSAHLFLQPAILLCFGYFVFQTIAGTGLQTQGTTALHVTFDIPLALAASAISAYLLGSTGGILAGGFLAARTEHHDRVAATGLAAGALLLASIGTGATPSALLLPVFALTGFAMGATGPSRDLIVRNATPRGAGTRLRFRRQPRRRRYDRADLVRGDARPRARPRHVLRGCGDAAGGDRHGDAHPARADTGGIDHLTEPNAWTSASRGDARSSARRARDSGAAVPRRWRTPAAS
jgi:MFS family permease